MTATETFYDEQDFDQRFPIDKFTSSEIHQLESYLTLKNSSLKNFIARNEPFEFIDLFQKNLHDKDMVIILKYGVYEKRCPCLNLARNYFTYRSMPLLSHAIRRMKTLKELDLSFNPIGDEGAKILAEVLTSANCFLEELDLTCTNIGNEGAQYLATALPQNHRLKRLILNKNEISKEGLDAFVAPLINPQTTLTTLKFEQNRYIQAQELSDFLHQITLQQCNIKEIYFTHCLIGSKQRPHRVLNCCNGSVKVIC